MVEFFLGILIVALNFCCLSGGAARRLYGLGPSSKIFPIRVHVCGAIVALALLPATANAEYAYITNLIDDTISVIDTATDTVTATIPTGVDLGGIGAAAVTPDGTKVYIANDCLNCDGTVLVIDTATNSVSATIPVGRAPNSAAVTPDGAKVYVGNNTSGTVSVITTVSNQVTATIPMPGSPKGIAATPDSTKVYVANNNGKISVIATASDNIIATVDLPFPSGIPRGVAVSPDGTKTYVAIQSGAVAVIDTETNTLSTMIPVGIYPVGVAVTPDGTRVYVNDVGSTEVEVIDTATNAVTATIPLDHSVFGIAVTADGAKVYVTDSVDGVDEVVVIGTASNTVTATIPVGHGPVAFGKFIGGPPSGSGSPPVAVAETATTNADTPVTIDLAAGAKGNPTSAALVGTPVGGMVTGFPATNVTFTPATGFTGTASFQFTLANAAGPSNTATATITVIAPPTLAPVAKDQTKSTTAGKSVTIDLAAGATGNPTSAAIVTKPSHGGYAISGTQATYLADVCYGGSDSFTFTLSNANGASNVASATINVAPAQGPTVASTKVRLVDPFLLGIDDLSNITPTKLSQVPSWDAVGAEGLVADKVSAALVIVETDNAQDITLTTTNGTTLFDFDPSFLIKSPTQGKDSILIHADRMCHVGGGYYAAAWVQGPLGVTPPSYTDKIIVTARQGGRTTSSPAIELVPPPVVLVHGIWSDNTTLGGIFSFLQNVPPWDKHPELVETLCYSKFLAFDAERDPATKDVADSLTKNSISPCEQTSRDAISSTVHELLTILDSKHIVGSRVDVVAHSMGGLAARWVASQDKYKKGSYRYLRNRGKGEFHKIVTLDTPELGSELARFLVDHSGDRFLRDIKVPLIDLPKSIETLLNPVEWYFSEIDPTTGFFLNLLIDLVNDVTVCSKGQTVAQCFAQEPNPGLPIAAPNALVSSGAVSSLIPSGPSLSNSKLVAPNIPDAAWYAAGSVAPANGKLAWLLDSFIAGIYPPPSTGANVPTVNSILGWPLVSNDGVVSIPSQLPATQAYLSRTFQDLSHTQLPIVLKIIKAGLRDDNVVESNDVRIFVRCGLSGICGEDAPSITPPPIPSSDEEVKTLLGTLEDPCTFFPVPLGRRLNFHAHRSAVTGVRLDLANPSLRLHPWADGSTIPGPMTLDSRFVSYSVVPVSGPPVVSLDAKTGILTGLRPGTATITGQCGSQTDTLTVKVGSEQPMPAN